MIDHDLHEYLSCEAKINHLPKNVRKIRKFLAAVNGINSTEN